MIENKISQIIDIAIKECERMYPIFNVVLTKGMDPKQALYPMMMETKGNADRAIEEGMSLIAEHNRVEEQPTLFYILLGAAGLLGVVLGVVLIVIVSVNRKADGYNDSEGTDGDDHIDAPQGDSIGNDREDEMDR